MYPSLLLNSSHTILRAPTLDDSSFPPIFSTALHHASSPWQFLRAEGREGGGDGPGRTPGCDGRRCRGLQQRRGGWRRGSSWRSGWCGVSNTSHVTPHTSHVTRHTSHVTRHTSHLTHHTSHVTRHTSHVTRHTSHVTQHSHVVNISQTHGPNNRNSRRISSARCQCQSQSQQPLF